MYCTVVHTTQPSDRPFPELQAKLMDNLHTPHDVLSTEDDHSAYHSTKRTVSYEQVTPGQASCGAVIVKSNCLNQDMTITHQAVNSALLGQPL